MGGKPGLGWTHLAAFIDEGIEKFSCSGDLDQMIDLALCEC